MKNVTDWRPTKYVNRGGKLIASRNPKEVGIGSRLMADLIAACYDEHLKQHARGRLIDLGCGKAPLFGTYQSFVSEVTCVDWPNSVHGSKHVDHECDLTRRLPFEDGVFDTVILSDVLEHIPEPQLLCNEISRILAVGGRLMLNVPFYYWIHEAPYDFHRYTEFALRRYTEESRMHVILLEAYGGAPEILADIIAKNSLRFPLIGKPVAMFVQEFTWWCLKTGWGKKMSNETKSQFPLGYFLVAEKRSLKAIPR